MNDRSDAATPEFTYGTYLRIPELLSLQQPASDPPEHDETLFIIIHQVYELWFKQVLHELDQFVDHLNDDHPHRGHHLLKRVLKIFKTLVAQLDVLETMTPLEFESFRKFLANASGFQSVQFRELEFLLGAKSEDHLKRFADQPELADRLRRRLIAPSLWDAYVAFLDRAGYSIDPEVLTRDVRQPLEPSASVQDALVEVYRTNPALAELCESLTDLDEGLQEWRYRHVKMVQRTIGTKPGTGGSAGSDYLKTTLFRPVFPDLWEIRVRF
ncbi:MAG: tryptophan 2,3-dioxygenase [Acidimicrobiales bacterium]|nr:tryptophan 2,3-dioxygenase [Acidimicrobiales bacterium]